MQSVEFSEAKTRANLVLIIQIVICIIFFSPLAFEDILSTFCAIRLEFIPRNNMGWVHLTVAIVEYCSRPCYICLYVFIKMFVCDG